MSDACRKVLTELMQDEAFARAMRAAPGPTLRRVRGRFDSADYQALIDLGRDALSVLEPAGTPGVPGAGPAAGGTPPGAAAPCGTPCVRYPIHGRVEFVGNTTRAVGGVTVELWERDATWTEARASVVTDAAGRFDVALDERLLSTASPVIYFRVAIHGDYVAPDPTATWSTANATERVVLTIAGTHVEGYVRYVDGTPVANTPVSAFASQMRTEDLLGAATTDSAGHYAIDCAFAGSKLDLIVRAYQTPAAGGAEIAHSDLITDVAQLASVDLVVGNVALAGTSEYGVVSAAIDASRGAVLAKDLTAADITQVAAKYNLSEALVQLVVDANGASTLAGAGLLPELFYAIGRRTGRVTVSSALAISAADRAAAVTEAIGGTRVPASFANVASAQLATLAGLVTGLTLTDSVTTLPTRLAMIMRTAGMSSSTDRQALLNAYAGFTGTPEAFWAAAPALLPGISTGLLSDVRAALHMGIYTMNHPPLLQSLWNSGIRTAAALGGLSSSDWTTRIASTVTLPGGASVTVGFPNEIVGASDAVKSSNYAAALATVNQRVFPSNAFRTAYTANPISSTTPLATFLTAHTDFDFAQQSIYAYVRANPTAFSGNAAGLPQVEKLARLFKISPEVTRYGTAKALWDAGFTSARSVYLFGKETFIAKMTASPYSLSTASANQIYAKASHITGVAGSISMMYGQAFQPPGIGGALSVQSQTSEIPDWATIFGSLDYCACDECASVLGPAAYLTDLLHFLEQRPDASGAALTQLKARRPDLTKVELTCKNTNTVLPYIDLLNERLELKVSWPGTDPAYQTTWTEGDLAIHPEHARHEAYNDLLTKVYPWRMPYNLWADESRTYIGLKGVTRSEIRAATILEPFADLGWGREVRGMTDLQEQIIQGSTSTAAYAFWGMVSGSPWFNPLITVTNLMTRSGLSYDDVAEVVATTFVSSAQAPAVGIDLQDCNLTTAQLTNVTSGSDPFFDHFHRFDRLQQSQGWTIRQTDRAIMNLGGGALDAMCLAQIADAKEVVRKTTVSLDDALTWSADALIDTAPDATTGLSPFEMMFPRRTVWPTGAPTPAIEPFALSADRTELAVESSPPPLANYYVDIASGLGSDLASIQAIVAYTSLTTAALTLANISTLFRYVSLAKSLRMSVSSMLTLIELSGRTPFAPDAANIPGMFARYRADVGITPSGTKVSAWADSVSGHTASQATGSKQPVFNPSVAGFNGHPTVQFDGTEVLVTGAFNLSAPYTVFVIGRVTTTGPAYIFSSNTADSTLCALNVEGQGPAGVVRFYDAAASSGLYSGAWFDPCAGAFISKGSGGADKHKQAFNSNALINVSGTGANPIDVLRIGNYPDGGAYAGFEFAEIIFFSRELTANEVAQLQAYARERYGIFAPLMLPNCVAWYRADTNMAITSGHVTTWYDQAHVEVANRDLVQATSGAQPTLTASSSSYNNRAVVTSDGGDYLATANWGTSYAQPTTVYCVGKTGGGRIFDGNTSGHRQAILEQSGHWSMYAGGAVVEGTLSSSTPAVVCAVLNGADSRLYVSDSRIPIVTGNPGSNPLDVLGVLGTTNGTGLGSPEVAEIICFSGAHDATTRRKVMQYLGARYGKTVT